MLLVCCPLMEPGVTFVVVRFLHWDDGDDDTHFFPILPSVGRLRSIFATYSRHYTFRNLVRSWSSSSKTTFSFSVSTVSWCRTPSLGHLSGTSGASQRMGWPHVASYTATPAQSVPQSHRWFLLKVHFNAPIASARLVAARVVEKPVQCCFCSRSSVVSTICHAVLHTVLDVYNSVRDAANLPPIIDGRHSLMLQERWEGSVLASIVAFFFAIWTVRSMHKRGAHFLSFLEFEGFSTGQPPMSMVGALLSHAIPQTTTTRAWFVRHCQLQESQSTDLMVHVGVKAPLLKHLQIGVQLCGRPMLVVWVLAWLLLRRVVSLETTMPKIKLNILSFFSVCFERFVCRTLTLFLKWTL